MTARSTTVLASPVEHQQHCFRSEAQPPPLRSLSSACATGKNTAAWCVALAKSMSNRPDEWTDVDSMFLEEDAGASMLGVSTLINMAQEQCLEGRAHTATPSVVCRRERPVGCRCRCRGITCRGDSVASLLPGVGSVSGPDTSRSSRCADRLKATTRLQRR